MIVKSCQLLAHSDRCVSIVGQTAFVIDWREMQHLVHYVPFRFSSDCNLSFASCFCLFLSRAGPAGRDVADYLMSSTHEMALATAFTAENVNHLTGLGVDWPSLSIRRAT